MEFRGSQDPVQHDDLECLDDEIDDYIATFQAAEETLAGREKHWRAWERLCAAKAVDPCDAPYSTFEDLLLSRREDGLPYSVTYMFSLLSSVRHEYAARGLVPANQRAENRGAWSATFKGWQRDVADAVGRGEAATYDHVPLMREQFRTMLAVPLTTGARTTQRRTDMLVASALVAIDTGWNFGRVMNLRVDQVVTISSTEMELDGERIECHCTGVVPGVPWDCLCCAIRKLVATRTGQSGRDLRFFDQAERVEISRWLRKQSRNWNALRLEREGRRTFRLRIDDTADAWTRAGTRRGLVFVAHQPDFAAWLRGRAWLALAWQAGLRMSSDLVRLPRRAIAPLHDPATGLFMGWQLHLGVAKNDPFARREDVRVYTVETGQKAVDAISEYLCVRDAAQGRDGLLIVGGHDSLFGRAPMKKPLQAAKNDLDELAALGDLEPVFTSYSIRKGFVAQAAKDGWSLDRIRTALRHKKHDTTAGYFPKQNAKLVATKFYQELVQERRGA